MNVAGVVERYIGIKEWELSAATVRNYRQQLSYLRRQPFAEEDAGTLTPLQIDDFYIEMRKQHKGVTYIRRCHALLTAAFRWSVKKKVLTSNPFVDCSPPRATRTHVSAPSPEQVRMILSSSTPPWSLMFRLAAATGMRRGELCGLKTEDVSCPSSPDGTERYGLVVVRRSVTRGRIPGDTKTHKDRSVSISAELAEQLLDMARQHGSEWLFVEPDGRAPVEPDHATREFDRVCKRLGYSGFTLHGLRHFAATQMIAAKVDIKTVSDRLGHSDVQITLNTYADVIKENAREAGDLLEGLLK
jgi:integrase